MKKILIFLLVAVIVVMAISYGSKNSSLFKEVTRNTSIRNTHYAPSDIPEVPEGMEDKMNYMNYFMSGDAEAFDYDGDGWTDVYITRIGGPGTLFKNNRDKTFTDTTKEAGLTENFNTNGVTSGDIDNDGDLDLFVTTIWSDKDYLYINNGDGTFSEGETDRGINPPATETHFGYDADFGDYDNDGYQDLYVTEWRFQLFGGTTSHARLLRNKGVQNPGHFEDVTIEAGVFYADALVDHDGTDAASTFSFEPRFSDLDQDGWLDLVVAGDFGTSKLFWNNGNGIFTNGTEAANFGTEENGMGIAIADYDKDGLDDVFITSIYDEDNQCIDNPLCFWGDTGNRLYRNNGDRTFTDTTDGAGVRDGGWGWDTVFFDYDLDGDQDLLMVNGVDFPTAKINGAVRIDAEFNWQPKKLWRNDGGKFTDVALESGIKTKHVATGLAVFDYDNDGDEDILIINNGAKPVFYENTTQ